MGYIGITLRELTESHSCERSNNHEQVQSDPEHELIAGPGGEVAEWQEEHGGDPQAH